MRAVVYSFDAYVAVVIALIGVGLLLTYSSVESNYIEYYQAKILSIDGLRILIEADVLSSPSPIATADAYLQKMIPEQYSYRFYSVSDPTTVAARGDVDNYKKLRVSTSVVIPYVSDYSTPENPYKYKSCSGVKDACSSVEKRPITPDLIGFEEYVLVIAI